MKKYIYTLAAISCAMFASCSKDGEIDNLASQSTTITEISASSDSETRAVVSSSDITKINWESGDAIKVFGLNSSSEAANADYKLSSAEGSTSGTFTNAASTVSTIHACMYPAQTGAAWDNTNSQLSCSIPSVQTAVKGSFDKVAAIMYSIGNSSEVVLNSAVAFFKVAVSESNAHSITIIGPSTLSGNVEIKSSGVTAASTGSEAYVTLQADASNGALTPGDYYIAVLPGTYTNLSIVCKYTDHTAKVKASSSSLTIQTGHVKAISVDFSTGARDAIQMWAGGPYFATMNLGETTVSGNTKRFSCSDAMGSSAKYSVTGLWGYAWRVPTQAELDGLAGKNATAKVNPFSYKTYADTSVYGFEFTPKDSGYTASLFLPVFSSSPLGYGYGTYWSSTTYSYLHLDYDTGDYSSWETAGLASPFFIRPVLR